MAKEKNKAKIKGVARIKKFNADQDETKDEPVDVHEVEFELNNEQLKQIQKGKKLEIKNGEVIIKE